MSDNKYISKRLINLRAAILKRYPFFGVLLMKMKFGLAKCGTAFTDMERIVFDPEFADRLSDDEMIFVMMHEVMHCVLKHPIRGKGKIHELYNIACDIVVNSNLLEFLHLNPDTFTVNGSAVMHLTLHGAEGREKTAEEVYNEFLRKRQEDEFEGSPVSCPSLDNHEVWDVLEIQEIESDRWDKAIEELKNYSLEDTPQAVRNIFENALKQARLRWKELLRDFVSSCIFCSDYSFTPPDRRFMTGDFFLPDERYFETEEIQNIWFVVDTSGSISKQMLTRMVGEVINVVNEVEFASGLVSFFDTKVTEPVPFSKMEDFNNIRPTGGGGTRFDIIFNYMQENMWNKYPNAIVILTDGYAPPVNEKMAAGVPVLWILVNNTMKMPWGRTIHVDTEDVQ